MLVEDQTALRLISTKRPSRLSKQFCQRLRPGHAVSRQAIAVLPLLQGVLGALAKVAIRADAEGGLQLLHQIALGAFPQNLRHSVGNLRVDDGFDLAAQRGYSLGKALLTVG